MTHREFAQALQHGVDTAYKAVIKPVEGTVLTVAREAAKHGKVAAIRVNDVAELMEEVLQAAKKALDQTPGSFAGVEGREGRRCRRLSFCRTYTYGF